MNEAEINPAAAQEAASPANRLEQALARLDQSRARLRVALTPEPAPPAEAAGRSFSPVRRARAWLRTKSWGTLLDPIVGAANQAVMDWWKRQPLVRSALLAQSTLSAELSPLVRRYPIPAVLLTAALGAIAARSGVWRWRTVRRSGLLLALQLRRVLIGQLGSPAVQSLLLGALVSYLAARKVPAHPDPDPHPVSDISSGPGADRGPVSPPTANHAAIGE